MSIYSATKAAVEAEGRRCILIAGDVSKRAFCFDAVKKAMRAFGRLSARRRFR